MKASIIVTTYAGKLDLHSCEIGGYDVEDPNSEKELRILERIFARHSEQIRKELEEELEGKPASTTKEFRTGIINPATGKEWILSDYYEDETGNRHFTHAEAMKIWDSLPGWGPCTEEFHKALRALVWDEEDDDWREDVNGTGWNGFEYMTQKLGYELGGFRHFNGGTLWSVGYSGYSWSSTESGTHAYHLGFYYGGILPQASTHRACGLQFRFIRE